MDHDIVLFAELYSSVYNNIVAVVSITCQIKSRATWKSGGEQLKIRYAPDAPMQVLKYAT
jgi:hypothetical protein